MARRQQELFGELKRNEREQRIDRWGEAFAGVLFAVFLMLLFYVPYIATLL